MVSFSEFVEIIFILGGDNKSKSSSLILLKLRTISLNFFLVILIPYHWKLKQIDK